MIRFLTLALLLSAAFAHGQDTSHPNGAQDSLPRNRVRDTSFIGIYGIGDSVVAHILYQGNNLFIALSHYGNLQLAKEGTGRYNIPGVRPKCTIVFDSAGMTIYQKGDFTFFRDPSPTDTSAAAKAAQPQVGRYTQDIDIYNIHHITATGDRMTLDGDTLVPVAKNLYRLAKNPGETYELLPPGHGRPQRFIAHSSAPRTFTRISGNAGANVANDHSPDQRRDFTRADTLLGMLTPLRTCYDALFYNLDIKIDPDTRTIQGNVLIRFRTLAPFDSLQLDLAQTMTIDSLLYHGQPLPYSRELGAVYVHFPERMQAGRVEELRVRYHGKPRLPDINVLKGGFFWRQDRNRHPWFESVCQGTGASLWWPCKDHNSDKPDSVRISITVPRGLADVSNGRFLDSVDLPGNWTRWDWYVSYPINVYNVVANVGNYVHFGSTYIHGTDTIPLNFYTLPYDMEKAHDFAAKVPPMLDLYEQDFGPYPFPGDGYKLVDALWPMEHQSAVGIGPFSHADDNTFWHESAHEYWGNNVTCRDYADFWIHESFATYAEVLNLERQSPAAALKYLKDGVPGNKQPMIGVYNVNNFKWGDIYTKGPLMIRTLQHCIDNDSLWFSILRGIQQRYRHGTVTTEDIVAFFNQATGTDYTPIFDQYLRYTRPPELVTRLTPKGPDLEVQYYWKVDVPGFAMPVKIGRIGQIHPTTTPQTMTIPNMKPEEFKVDTDDFYIVSTVNVQ